MSRFPTWNESRTRWNVKDFGAFGDGIQDDGPAILAAIKAIQEDGGGTLRLEGTFRIGGTFEEFIAKAIGSDRG